VSSRRGLKNGLQNAGIERQNQYVAAEAGLVAAGRSRQPPKAPEYQEKQL
jgi:hypothetical protein